MNLAEIADELERLDAQFLAAMAGQPGLHVGGCAALLGVAVSAHRDAILSALRGPDEVAIERAAERVWHELPLLSQPGDRWETVPNWIKERCRMIARAALAAARGEG